MAARDSESPSEEQSPWQWQCACLEGDDPAVAVVPVPASFCLQQAVCSYGFFMMAPNRWTPAACAHHREAEEALAACRGSGVAAEGAAGANEPSAEEPPPGDSDGAADGRLFCGRLVRPLRLAGGQCVTVAVERCPRGAAGGLRRAEQGDAPGPSCPPAATHAALPAPSSPATAPSAQRCPPHLCVRLLRPPAARPASPHSPAPLPVSPPLSAADRLCLRAQVVRMLRLSASDAACLAAFHQSHAAAQAARFGRIFRSPCLFEDLVKCVLLCNCRWSRSLSMASRLCSLFPPDTPPSADCPALPATPPGPTSPPSPPAPGPFPSPHQLAALDAPSLQRLCGLGYRAARVLSLARAVAGGQLDLPALERQAEAACGRLLAAHQQAGAAGGGAEAALAAVAVLRRQVLALPGFGPYSAGNALQCLGLFCCVPADSETVRHLRAKGLRACASGTVQALADREYARHAPFQFLAYWFEMWNEYQRLSGPIAYLSREQYGLFTGSNMKALPPHSADAGAQPWEQGAKESAANSSGREDEMEGNGSAGWKAGAQASVIEDCGGGKHMPAISVMKQRRTRKRLSF